MIFSRSTFIVAIFSLTLVGCLKTTVEDSPTLRKTLGNELAHMAFSSGLFDVMINQGVEQGSQAVAVNMHRHLGRELTKSEYDKMKFAFREAFLQTYPVSEWEAPVADLYGKHLNAQELTEIIAFYKTPIGKRALELQGLMATEGEKMGIRIVEKKKDQFGDAFVKEIEKAGLSSIK
jgi:hypothetical protein